MRTPIPVAMETISQMQNYRKINYITVFGDQ